MIGWASLAGAQVILDSADLPPDVSLDPRCQGVISLYQSDEELHALYPGGVDMTDVQHECFVNATTTQVGPDQQEDFDSTVKAKIDLGGGTEIVELSGPVTTTVQNRTGSQTGTFDTEIVSLGLTGDVGGIPIQIRESPSQQSAGQATITDIGGGQFAVDSFFDVYTEISINGGPFMPQTNGASRMTLVNKKVVPAIGPLGLGLLATSIGVLGVWARRRVQS
jgi:hypothetical protein